MNKRLSLISLAVLSPALLPADAQSDIPLGIEAVAGYRSGYEFRGFELAENTLDFQLETEIALNNDTYISLGTWYATETGDGDFDQTGLFAHINFETTEKLTIGLSATYRAFSHSTPPLSTEFEDGLDLGSFATYHFSRDLAATIGSYYDTGADAWYSHIETNWSKALGDKSYIQLKTGISYVNDYYERDGLNDAYSRLSLTYHISDTVSITPFIGASILLDNDDSGDDQLFGGTWFEVRF